MNIIDSVSYSATNCTILSYISNIPYLLSPWLLIFLIISQYVNLIDSCDKKQCFLRRKKNERPCNCAKLLIKSSMILVEFQQLLSESRLNILEPDVRSSSSKLTNFNANSTRILRTGWMIWYFTRHIWKPILYRKHAKNYFKTSLFDWKTETREITKANQGRTKAITIISYKKYLQWNEPTSSIDRR